MIKVGDTAVHTERFYAGHPPREVLRVKIVRETKTQWIDDHGDRWRKSDCANVPQYAPEPRYLMSVEDFEAAIAKHEGGSGR